MKNYFEVFSTKKIKRVLSFDGGGVRAIAGVVFLKQLEVATGKFGRDKIFFHQCQLHGKTEHLFFTQDQNMTELVKQKYLKNI